MCNEKVDDGSRKEEDIRYFREGYNSTATDLNKIIVYVSFGMFVAVLIVPETIGPVGKDGQLLGLDVERPWRWIATIWYMSVGLYFGVIDKFFDLHDWRRKFNDAGTGKPTIVEDLSNWKYRLWQVVVVLQCVAVALTTIAFGIEVF